MAELTNEEMGAMQLEVLVDRFGCNCVRALGSCAFDEQPVTMCPNHTRCRIVRVRSIAAEIETARMLNASPPTITDVFNDVYAATEAQWGEIFKP